jgi:hypothetical protein
LTGEAAKEERERGVRAREDSQSGEGSESESREEVMHHISNIFSLNSSAVPL